MEEKSAAQRHCAEWMGRNPLGKQLAIASRFGGTNRGGEEARILVGANGHTLEPLPTCIVPCQMRITKISFGGKLAERNFFLRHLRLRRMHRAIPPRRMHRHGAEKVFLGAPKKSACLCGLRAERAGFLAFIVWAGRSFLVWEPKKVAPFSAPKKPKKSPQVWGRGVRESARTKKMASWQLALL